MWVILRLEDRCTHTLWQGLSASQTIDTPSLQLRDYFEHDRFTSHPKSTYQLLAGFLQAEAEPLRFGMATGLELQSQVFIQKIYLLLSPSQMMIYRKAKLFFARSAIAFLFAV